MYLQPHWAQLESRLSSEAQRGLIPEDPGQLNLGRMEDEGRSSPLFGRETQPSFSSQNAATASDDQTTNNDDQIAQ